MTLDTCILLSILNKSPGTGESVITDEIIVKLNPILRGWGNYFRTGNASAKFNEIDRYVRMRLCRVMVRRGGQRRPNFRWKDWPHLRFVEDHGLHKLLGTIRYPGGAHAG